MFRDKLRWIFYSDMLRDEYRQCLMEGKDVECLAPAIEEALAVPDEKRRERKARELLIQMESSGMKSDFAYEEPESYAEIEAGLDDRAKKRYPYDKDQAGDRIRGAWYGRSAGCVLGIPVEGWPRQKIIDYLKSAGQFPLKDYIFSSQDPEIRKRFDIEEKDVTTPYDRQKVCWINCLDGKMPNDDDVNYTVAALKLVERSGRGFTADDVAETWLFGIPPLHACTAERAAIRNLMTGILPPDSAVICNPYREWIGAQIRGDFFGYINPGDPREAARMAYLDASVSHTKNGVYGEMWIAALLSLCFVEDLAMEERISLAMLQIPSGSRLRESLEVVVKWYREGRSFDSVVEIIHRRYDEKDMFDWCLTVPNAMLVCACILWYRGYDEAVSAAVLSGFDTDCNGATVGSVMGLAGGFGAIDPKWYAGFDGKLYTSVHGYHEISLDEAVRRTLRCI